MVTIDGKQGVWLCDPANPAYTRLVRMLLVENVPAERSLPFTSTVVGPCSAATVLYLDACGEPHAYAQRTIPTVCGEIDRRHIY